MYRFADAVCRLPAVLGVEKVEINISYHSDAGFRYHNRPNGDISERSTGSKALDVGRVSIKSLFTEIY
jgi:hypothetical protein